MPRQSSASIARQSHRDRIYDLLVARIQRGEMTRSERLVDTTLAGELGVSRMPVRDALMRLAHEGYLEPTTRGFTLPNLSRREVLDVFEIRRLLEPRAAALAAQAMAPAGLAVLDSAVGDAVSTLRSGDVGLFFRASERFRNGWLAAVPNAALQQTIQRYLAQVQMVRLATMRDAAVHRIIVTGLQDLHAAFAAGDAVAAADRVLRFVIEGEIAYRTAAAGAEDGDGHRPPLPPGDA